VQVHLAEHGGTLTSHATIAPERCAGHVLAGTNYGAAPVRILQIAWEYPPLIVGGLSAHVDGLARALARRGHDVVVLTRFHPDAPDDAVVEGVRVIRAHTDLPWTPPEQFHTGAVSANHAITRIAAPLIAEGWKPDIVHNHDWLTAWSADVLRALFDAPYVATVHATELGRNGGHLSTRNSEAINATEWWLTFTAQRVICCSDFMVEEVLRSFQVPASKLAMIPNGVDPASWAPPTNPPARTDNLIVTWGRIEYEKGFQTLIEAMPAIRARVPDAHVVVVGRGSYLDQLKWRAGELGLLDSGAVLFNGFTPDDELRALLHRATCAVIPSFYEPFGIVALEAMAAGAPCVVAASGGLREVIDGTAAGLSFPPGDVAALGDAVIALLSDHELAESSMANARHAIATRFSWDPIAEMTEQEYVALVAQ
jgi:glycogen synthase